MAMIEQQMNLDSASHEWTEVLSQRLAALGHTSLTAYADSRPTASIPELASDLGGEPFALEQRLVEEADAAGQMQRCARSLLARDLRSEIPEGWRRQRTDGGDAMVDQAFRIKGVFLTLMMTVPEAHHDALERIETAMDSAELPEGWLPEGGDDAALIELFESWWSATAT
jgi:hypothetical protein